MNAMTAAALAATLAAALCAPPSMATVIGGGGGASTDCLVVLDAPVNAPASKPKQVRCVDGDPSCDADGTANGVCQFQVSVCANSTFDAACALDGVQSITVEHAADNGDPKFDPDFQALQDRIANQIALPTTTLDDCTTPTLFTVPIKGPLGGSNHCGPGRTKLKISSLSTVIGGRVIKDRDKLKLTCIPDPNACDPHALFSGTFDRIQRQIFNQSCALSGCHDSQSMAGNMLLETGSSYGNLLNHTPDNAAANAAGWLRISVTQDVSGDAESSFLYHKVTGDLPDVAYGVRMPKGKRKLHKTLRDILRRWIEAGAPQGGWVPGTD